MIQYRTITRPETQLSAQQQQALALQCRDIARSCFGFVPDYQCLAQTKRPLDQKILTIAYDQDRQPIGFCSALRFHVPGVGNVVHLGLTCVDPAVRGAKLTHTLTRQTLVEAMLSERQLGRLWISNVACVLSSLGNVAKYFEAVYPSPMGISRPSKTHRRIAASISGRLREEIYIHTDAIFDEKNFVFRGSVRNTVFQKTGDGTFAHRDPQLNQYYRSLMNFANGDEVLQVGYVTPLTAVKHWAKRQSKRLRWANPRQLEQLPAQT